MLKEIKPCPFCGGEAAVGKVRYSEATTTKQGWLQNVFFFVNCIVCGSNNKGLVGHLSETEAINKWNARPLVDRMREALEGALHPVSSTSILRAEAILKETE